MDCHDNSTFKPPASTACCSSRPTGYVRKLRSERNVENVTLKALEAEQVVVGHFSVPSGQLAVHQGGIRSYSMSWNSNRQRRQGVSVVFASIRVSVRADASSISSVPPSE